MKNPEHFVCLNCNTSFEGNFCTNCGQKKNSKRLNLKDLAEDTASNIFNFEAPLIRTFIELSLRPGKFCREFIEGKRASKYRPSPITFFVQPFISFFTSLPGSTKSRWSLSK